MDQEAESFYIGIVTKGQGVVASGDQQYPLRTWDRFIVPKKTDRVTFSSGEGMELLTIYPPMAPLEEPGVLG